MAKCGWLATFSHILDEFKKKSENVAKCGWLATFSHISGVLPEIWLNVNGRFSHISGNTPEIWLNVAG